LKDGISFRSIGKYKKNKWQTIYNFYCKLIQNNAIKIIFFIVNHYNEKNINNNIFITDRTLIPNKLGINNVGYNPQYPKHVSFRTQSPHMRLTNHVKFLLLAILTEFHLILIVLLVMLMIVKYYIIN
jgi:hypothetical protein